MTDLLIVRLCLLNAYIFLMLNSLAGGPLWPHLTVPGKVFQLDGVFWATLNLFVHLSTVIRLLRDERQVSLTNDKLALWRMFYRTGGLSQVLFYETVAQHCTIVTVEEGTHLDLQTYFYILYKGTVQITLMEHTHQSSSLSPSTKNNNTAAHSRIISRRNAWSGQLFDFRALGMVQELSKEQNNNSTTRITTTTSLQGVVVSTSGATLFQFRRSDMPRIVQTPSSRLVWKELLTETLLNIVKRYFHSQPPPSQTKNSTTSSKTKTPLQSAPSFYHNNDQLFVSPLFAPLEEWETPAAWQAGSGSALKNPLAHIVATMQRSFAPPWPFSSGPPTGLRHSLHLGNVPKPRGQQKEQEQTTTNNNSIVQHSNAAVVESTPLLSSSKSTTPLYQQENDEEALLLGGMHLVDFVKFPQHKRTNNKPAKK